MAAYINKFGYINVLTRKKTKKWYRAGLIYILLPRKMRKFLLKYIVLVKYFGAKSLINVIVKKAIKIFTKKAERFKEVNRSLRKINREIPLSLREDEVSTAVLREG